MTINKLEPEMYYSINDLAKMFNCSTNQMMNTLDKKGIKPYNMIGGRKCVFGKTINHHFLNKKTNFDTTKDILSFIPNNKKYQLFTQSEIAKELNKHPSFIKSCLIEKYQLKPYKKEGATLYYQGEDINNTIQQINDDRKFSFYPNLLDDERTYYTAQIIQNLKISMNHFKKLYVERFGLKPINQENITGYNHKILYDGYDINRISKKIRNL